MERKLPVWCLEKAKIRFLPLLTEGSGASLGYRGHDRCYTDQPAEARQAIGRAYAMGIAGLLFGVVLALVIGRLLGSALYLVPHEHSGMLYGVKIYDPLSIAVASVVLLAVLFLASFLPARRAMRVDPMVALRYE